MSKSSYSHPARQSCLISDLVLSCCNGMTLRIVAVAHGVIVGLERIGAAVGKSRWTVRRWASRFDFPIARLPDGHWALTPSLLDAWLLSRHRADELLNREKKAHAARRDASAAHRAGGRGGGGGLPTADDRGSGPQSERGQMVRDAGLHRQADGAQPGTEHNNAAHSDVGTRTPAGRERPEAGFFE